MKTFLLSVLLFLSVVVTPAFADNGSNGNSSAATMDVSSLTPEQRKAVLAVANQMKEQKSDASAIMQALQGVNKESVQGWAEAGTEAGKAVSNFAKEVGAVTTDFLNSFIGKATFILVFMNYGGGKLLKFSMDILWFISLTPIFLCFMYRVFQRFVLQIVVTKTVKYNPNVFLRLLGVNDKTTTVETMPGLKDDDGSNLLPVIGWAFIAVCSLAYFVLMWPKW